MAFLITIGYPSGPPSNPVGSHALRRTNDSDTFSGGSIGKWDTGSSAFVAWGASDQLKVRAWSVNSFSDANNYASRTEISYRVGSTTYAPGSPLVLFPGGFSVSFPNVKFSTSQIATKAFVVLSIERNAGDTMTTGYTAVCLWDSSFTVSIASPPATLAGASTASFTPSTVTVTSANTASFSGATLTATVSSTQSPTTSESVSLTGGASSATGTPATSISKTGVGFTFTLTAAVTGSTSAATITYTITLTGYDVQISFSPWTIRQAGIGVDVFKVKVKLWNTFTSAYVDWASQGSCTVRLRLYKVTSLTDTNYGAGTQLSFYNATSTVTSDSRTASGTEYTWAVNCSNPTGVAVPFALVAVVDSPTTHPGFTVAVAHGSLTDADFTLGWTPPTIILVGKLDTYSATVTVSSTNSGSLSGMSVDMVIDGESITATNGVGSVSNHGGPLTYSSSTTTLSVTADTGRRSSSSSAIPVIGYAVSTSDTGHRLPLDAGRFVVSTIANGQAPSTVVACPSVTLKTLLNDRNLTAIATEGLSFSFPLNEAGIVTYGFLRSVKVKWAITTFTYGGNRFKIDSSTDGIAWTSRASVIVPSESGTMTVDIGSMIGANFFRVYFDDGGTAATITFTHILPIGIQPGSPIDIVDAATSLPPVSTELYSIPTPPVTFDSVVDTYRDFKLLNRHPTIAYTVELVNLSTGIAGAADAVLDFTNLGFQNTSNVPISPQITVAANSSQTFRARYALASGNPLDGTHVGRIGARLVRTTNTDVRIFLANGSTDDIRAYDLNGTLRETYTGSGITPAAVAVDPYTQELYLLHAATGTTITVSVWKLGTLGAPDRTLTITGGGISSDTWTTLAAWHGYLYIGGSGTPGKIIVAGTKGTSTPYVTALTMSSTIAGDKYMTVSPEGYLFVSTGTSARTVDQWNLWTNTLVRTLNSGAQVAADHTGLMFDYKNREISIAVWASNVISWIRFHGDTGAFVQTKQKSDTDKAGSGVGALIADREYHGYSTTQLIWTTLKTHAGYNGLSFGTSLVGGAPFQLAWLY